MASLGSLVVSLEANTAKFTSDMGKAAYQTEQAMRQMERDAQMVGRAMGLMAVAAGGALVVMVKSSLDAMDNMSKLAQQTGTTTETLSALSYAAGLSGVSTESLGSAIVKLSKNMSDATQGVGEAGKGFKALGISVTGSGGALKSSDVIIGELAAKFATFKDGAEKTALAVNIFGKSGAQLIPLLNSGADGIRVMTDEAARMGLVMDSETSRAAEKFNDDLSRLAQTQTAFANSITTAVLPVLQAVATEMLGAAQQSNGFSAAGSAVRTVLETFVVLGSEVAFVFKGVGTEIGGMAAQLAALARGDLKGFTAISDAMKEDAARARVEHDKFVAGIMDRTPATVDSWGNEGRRTGTPAKGAAPRIPGSEANAAIKKAADDSAKALAFYNSLMEKASGYTNTYAADQNKLALALKNGAIGYDEYTVAVNKLMLQQPFIVKEMDDATKAAQERADLRNKEYEQIEDWFKKQAELYARHAEMLKAYQSAYALNLSGMGKGDSGRERLGGISSLEAQFKGQPELLAKALKDWDDYLAAKSAAEANWQLGAKEGLQNYLDDTANVYQSISNIAVDAFQGMEDAIVDFVKTGKLDFSSLADSIISDLVRIAVQQSITRPMAASMLNMFGLPSFAVGTDYVPRDMVAKIHQGERIVPAAQNRGGSNGGSQPITVHQNFTVGDVASVSMVRQAVAGSERRIAAGIGRSMSYGGALS